MNEGFSSGNIRESEKFIDLEKLIASKNKRLLRLIPQFAMNWFKKLVHIDQINALLYK